MQARQLPSKNLLATFTLFVVLTTHTLGAKATNDFHNSTAADLSLLTLPSSAPLPDDANQEQPHATHFNEIKVEAELVEPILQPHQHNDEESTTLRSRASARKIPTAVASESSKKPSLMVQMRGMLRKEMRKMKSSMTDAILEEVIAYYGKKLDKSDAQVLAVATRVTALGEQLSSLSLAFKNLAKAQRNLIDAVRNNMLTARRDEVRVCLG